MPTEGAMTFVRSLERDEDLQGKLKSIEADTKEALVKEVARVAAEAGFILTSDEVGAIVKEESEVTDAQLDHVVGGIMNIAPTPGTVPPVPKPPSSTYGVSGTTTIGGTPFVVLTIPGGF